MMGMRPEANRRPPECRFVFCHFPAKWRVIISSDGVPKAESLCGIHKNHMVKRTDPKNIIVMEIK